MADTFPVVLGTTVVSGGTAGSGDGAIIDGVDAGLKATVVDLADSNPLTVAIVDGNGDQITSFGGGTQYTEGDTDATITGTAILWEDAADTLRAVSSAKPLPIGDAGGSLTVDGTVAVSAVGGTVAVTQSGTWDEVGINDSGNSITVDATNLDIRDIDAATDDIAVHGDVGILDQLDLTNSNPAVVAIVDGNGDQITSFGGGTQYAQGTATTDTDVLTMAGAVRRDTAAVASGVADGDRLVLSADASGRLRVTAADTTQPVSLTSTTVTGTVAVTQSGTWDEVGINDSGNSITVDNGGTFATQATLQTGDNVVGRVKLTDGTDVADILDLANNNPLTVAIVDGSGDQITSFGGGTQYTEDAAAAANPVGTATILVRQDTPATLVTTDGDNVARRGTNYGAAYTQIVSSAGAFVDTFGGGTQYTEGDTDASITGTAMLWEDTSDTLRAVSAAKPLPIGDAGGSLTVDGTVTVAGGAAHDAPVSGNPVRVAAKGNANEPAAVSTDGDTVDLWSDLLGRLVVLTGHPNPEAPVSVNATASGDTDVITTPGASLSLYICKGSIHNAGNANITVLLQEDGSATTRWAALLAAKGGGSVFDFGSRGWKLTANTGLDVNLSAGGDVRVNITEYYIAA